MTKSPEFFDKILEALNRGVEEEERRKVIMAIHTEYDQKLAEALARWFDTQDVKVCTVISTLSYMIAAECYYQAEKPEDICAFAKGYGSYIHQIGHALWTKHGPNSKKSS